MRKNIHKTNQPGVQQASSMPQNIWQETHEYSTQNIGKISCNKYVLRPVETAVNHEETKGYVRQETQR